MLAARPRNPGLSFGHLAGDALDQVAQVGVGLGTVARQVLWIDHLQFHGQGAAVVDGVQFLDQSPEDRVNAPQRPSVSAQA